MIVLGVRDTHSVVEKHNLNELSLVCMGGGGGRGGKQLVMWCWVCSTIWLWAITWYCGVTGEVVNKLSGA